MTTEELVRNAASALRDACDTDEVYWEALAVGQDSEDAESSGYLMGYRDALEAVILAFRGDMDTLAKYTDDVRDTTGDRQHDVETMAEGPFFWDVVV